ncbi:MAG TPA: bifunctional hydroxymethylpyrimidine kinase/phosphomethylpyrimidine kinase [Methylovirgula sp.]|nr:bifunctional hydroxymethylpyrimidine kinase/phosphomethylpyrimidine kinase [Methylovirgula sp.]
MIPNVLSVAGFDPSGGAGVLADIKTFAALRCHGLAVATALTAQNTRGVVGMDPVPAEFVGMEIDALFADIEIAAVKIGMLAAPDIIETLAGRLAHYRPKHIVLDPVLVASSGDPLAIGDVASAILDHLAPLVTLVAPNLDEAAALAGAPAPTTLASMHKLAEDLQRRGFAAVLIKGGHLESEKAEDILFDGTSHRSFSAPRLTAKDTHGTGCTLSAAIAAELAQGRELSSAIEAAKAYVNEALATADALNVGHGPGPLHHFHKFW